MKYINKFQTSSEYNSFVESNLYVTPSISHIIETDKNEIRANAEFSIDGLTYNFQEGMTWEDWINHPNQSYYSRNAWVVDNSHIKEKEFDGFVYENRANFVRSTDYIMPGHSYMTNADPDCIIFYTTLNDQPINGIVSGTQINGGTVISNTVVDGIGLMIFQDKITKIENEVFSSGIAKMLTSLRLPDSVGAIFGQAFINCINLITVTVGSNTTSIGPGAFTGCSSLVEIDLLNSIRTIGNSAFAGCSQLKQVRNCASLLTVGDRVFYYCTNLEDIDLHNVTGIRAEAFYGCSNLKNAYLTNIEGLSGSAFYQCTSLKNVVLGDKLTDIYANTFAGCTSLETMTIGNSVQSGASGCFSGCTGKLTMNCGTPSFASAAESWFAGSQFHEINIQIEGNSPIQSIGSYTFAENSCIEKVVVNCQDIGSNAFAGCEFLKEVIIGNDVVTIQSSAFYECISLKKLSLGQQLVSIGNNAFQYCYLTSCVIPDSVWYIGTEAFESAVRLKKVHIGAGMSVIGARAFANTAIDTIILPSSIDDLGDECFKSLDRLFCLATISPIITDVTPLVKSNGLIYVPSTAIDGYKTASGWSVYADKYKGLDTSLTGRVVEYKTNNEQIVIPSFPAKSNTYSSDGGKISFYSAPGEIPSNAFEFCDNLIEATIPAKTTLMGRRIFHDCENLIKLIIPDGVTDIGDELCSGCTKLESVRLSANVKYLGPQAFYNCKKLTDIYMSTALMDIQPYTFSGCESLQEIILPLNILTIQDNAFANCTSLSNVYCINSTPPSILLSGESTTTSALFATVNTEGPFNIIVPKNHYDVYANNADWKVYSSNLVRYMTPIAFQCQNLSCRADAVPGNATTALITYTALVNAVDASGSIITTNMQFQKRSEEFPRNMSNTNVNRRLTVSYLGTSITTSVTQQPWVDKYYAVDLNGQWQKSTRTPNPDSRAFEGVYESFSNKGVNSKGAIMYIDIAGYSKFQLLIRSYGESQYDYVMVSNLDTPITNATAYNSAKVYAHTYNSSSAVTSIDGYQIVEFTNIDKMPHRITIVYRKDTSTHSYNDRGYVLIPYQYEEEPS